MALLRKQRSEMDAQDDFERVRSQMDTANTRMLSGDCSLWLDLLSQSDDVALLGAAGGAVQGRADAKARLERMAASYGQGGGGGYTSREPLASWSGPDLVCLVDLERHAWRANGRADLVEYVYRTTHVLRRERGDWRVVLRHADPLSTFQGIDFAHGTS
jgi:ketosteroid isomerase-like protein